MRTRKSDSLRLELEEVNVLRAGRAATALADATRRRAPRPVDMMSQAREEGVDVER